jgi:Thiopurine S-methyltransferase (TPMT)
LETSPVDNVPSIGPEFFDVRYAANRIPWDYEGVPNSLKVFLDKHHGPGRVLIPGCGSGYEIEAFSAGGWDVIGIDFSAVAVARARRLLGPLADKVYEGDFFTYPLRERYFDIIYERTFLCALLPDSWSYYAQRIATLTAPAGVLCGFFFLGPEEDPPPYPISQDQLDELLSGWFEKVEDNPVEDSLSLYAGKERWQIWRRKIPDS